MESDLIITNLPLDECAELKESFLTTCPLSWVKHFNKIRIAENYKAGVEDLKVMGCTSSVVLGATSV